MQDVLSKTCTAFAGTRLFARGALIDVALAIRAADADNRVLVFDDADGGIVDLNLSGSTAEMVKRLSAKSRPEPGSGATGTANQRGRGRPKLGVVAREVTLLPRHWEWLSRQPGGASQALRRLVDQARRDDSGQTETRRARERAYRFMSALAGDLPGFEEAARRLFADDLGGLAGMIATWPPDVAAHVSRLAVPDKGVAGPL